MENLLNVNQAAFILKVHPLTVRRYIKEGKLNAIKVGGCVRIKESQLQDINKVFTPGLQTDKSSMRKNIPVTKVFTAEDPFFRLLGRGAHVQLSS